MSLIIGAMVMAWLVTKTVPAAVSDLVTTLRASKAGEWGLIDKERDRKAARAQARREAIAALRTDRNKQAGGTGQYRPGVGAYLSDVYHGLWEDELEKRRAKRAARPPVGPDGKRPPASRVDQAVEAKVRDQRAKTGYLGRAARLLIDPVGGNRQPADTTQPAADPTPVQPDPTDDAPRTACPTCGATLTQKSDGWHHPKTSTCPDVWMDGQPDDDDTPTSVVHDNDDTTYRPTAPKADHVDRLKDLIAQNLAARIAQNRQDRGGLGLTNCQRCGTDVHTGFLTPRSVNGTTKQVCAACAVDLDLIRDGKASQARCDRCRTYTRQAGSHHCEPCNEALTSLQQVAGAAWFQVAPDGRYDDVDDATVCKVVEAHNTRGWKSDEILDAVLTSARQSQPTSSGQRCPSCKKTKLPQDNQQPLCSGCQLELDALYAAATQAVASLDPEGTRSPEATAAVIAAVKENDRYGWPRNDIADFVQLAQLAAAEQTTTPQPATNTTGGTDMNTATGDVHDVESCRQECEALTDDLTRIDTALDVIDEAIRQGREAAERIEGWLQSKNADACVPGMSAALDALSTDRIKEMMDAVTTAKRGVADTHTELTPLMEAAELIGGTDGSALNNR